MKKLFGLLLSITSFSALSIEINTPDYAVTIESNCANSEVTCNNISYTELNKETGESVSINSSTPQQFENDEMTYTVSKNDGMLMIISDDDDEVLANE